MAPEVSLAVPPDVVPVAAIAPYHVYRVLPPCVNLMWPEVEPLLLKATIREHGRFTPRDIYRWVVKDEQQLWVVTQSGRVLAAGMVRFWTHPTGKKASCWHLLGGERAREWAAAAFEAWSRECRLQGVTEMHIVGRKGWLKYVKPFGFELASVVLTREEV